MANYISNVTAYVTRLIMVRQRRRSGFDREEDDISAAVT